MVRVLTSTALFALALIPAAAQAGPAAPEVPGAIALTDGSKPYLIAHASGVQIYGCTGGAWTLTAPRATLTNDQGNVIGSHYAGPTWEARDGSIVKGRRDAGVRVGADAIDWLRLAVTSTAPGPDGDRLTHTTWIQRIHTDGGMAPAGACAAGATVEVPYTADYVFWK
jgi:hypothetical protein